MRVYKYTLDVHWFGFLIWLWWYIFSIEDHSYLVSFLGSHDVHFEFFDGLMPWLILMVGRLFFHHFMDSLDTQFSGSF